MIIKGIVHNSFTVELSTANGYDKEGLLEHGP